VSDTPQGPDWWQASDYKWYPPEQSPGVAPPPGAPPPGAPTPADADSEGPFALPGQPGFATYRPPPGFGGAPVRRLHTGARNALILGIASLICCGFILGPIAIFEGNKARKQIGAAPDHFDGDGLALGGMVLGAIGIAGWLAYMVFVFAAPT
jgi:hypothetical protein